MIYLGKCPFWFSNVYKKINFLISKLYFFEIRKFDHSGPLRSENLGLIQAGRKSGRKVTEKWPKSDRKVAEKWSKSGRKMAEKATARNDHAGMHSLWEKYKRITFFGHFSSTFRPLFGHFSDTFRSLFGHFSATFSACLNGPLQGNHAKCCFSKPYMKIYRLHHKP